MTFPMPAFSPTHPEAATAPFSAVKLLLGFNGTNLATTTTDESASPHTCTYSGTARIETAQQKFGTASHRPGTSANGALTVTYASDLNLGTLASDAFTIEAFLRTTSISGNHYIIRQYGSTASDGAWYLTVFSGVLTFVKRNTAGSIVTVSESVTLVSGTWHYITISKNSAGKFRLRFDGVMVANATPADATINPSVLALSIGNLPGSNVTNTNDYIDEIRITKDYDLYDTDADIAVPTAAFPRS
ncbi:LamG domain-containing protein [Mesorhizobium sp. Cs1321R2N1]|uniref:LamG domain-containing protein n=1 Tax=Mesorhizobium sp. Cs1321R2N1 TaxID=3015174 RepID=UPI00301BE4B9